jgi:eukaryotic-like serine/threonine-protein kinase
MGEPKRGSPGIDATLPRVNLSPPKREMVEVDPLIGTSLRHFRVEKVLGRGGMGSVYLGWDTSLERSVALKVLSPELAYDAEIVARFAREARTQAKVRHPNVTQIYFIGEDRGLHFFAMEYIDGTALDRLIESGEKIP